MKEQFHDLGFEVLDDGTVRLEQRDYCGESVLIDLHPFQLEYIARSVQPNAPNWMAERITTLERRLRWLRDRFEETRAAAPRDMYLCPEAFEFDAWIQASIDVANEYCADLVSVAGPALKSNDETNGSGVSDALPNVSNQPTQGELIEHF